MPARTFSWLVGGVLLVAVCCQAASGAAPWTKLAVFKNLEADPQEMYPISDVNGPWMIMATTFTGEGAEDQARQLIYELRKEFKVPAYSYQKKFEYSKPVRGKGMTPTGEQPLMRYRKDSDVVEIAVLVGDFASVDDPEAQKVLKKLKFAQPKTLAVDPTKTNQPMADFRTLQKQAKQVLLPKDSEDLKKGPMANSFVITNPILPQEYFVPKGVDKLVVEMNKRVPHSLLNCPEPYTVKIATFTGHAIILDQKRQEQIDRGEMPKSYLEDAAKSAHLVCESLRKKGYEAYEYHDRTSSIVTVGSFSSVGTKRPDGKIEVNPTIKKYISIFGPNMGTEPGKPGEIGKARKEAGIPLDLQPMPVEVPRLSISGVYERTAETRPAMDRSATSRTAKVR